MSRAKLNRTMENARDWMGVARGLAAVLRNGEADATAWRSVLDLHCRTNGRSTERLTRILQTMQPAPAPIGPFHGMLGDFDAAHVGAIAEQIRRDGYYVFETRVPAEVCDSIYNAAKQIDARAGRDPSASDHMAKFDPECPIAYVYDIPEKEIWRIPGYQKIIADPVFVNVSQSYFNAKSVMKQANLWWSATVDGKPDDHGAQLFHFDFDPAPLWLKFFVYLTDVTPKSGPHVYVKGSHRHGQEKIRELLSRGYVRVSDQEIAKIFGSENVKELCGPKGTVLAVDTVGFHKGKAPVEGHRLLAQLEFAMPMFVQLHSAPLPFPLEADPALEATRKKYDWAFARFPVTV